MGLQDQLREVDAGERGLEDCTENALSDAMRRIHRYNFRRPTAKTKNKRRQPDTSQPDASTVLYAGCRGRDVLFSWGEEWQHGKHKEQQKLQQNEKFGGDRALEGHFGQTGIPAWSCRRWPKLPRSVRAPAGLGVERPITKHKRLGGEDLGHARLLRPSRAVCGSGGRTPKYVARSCA